MKKETKRAIRDAFAKLSFRSQAQNPVMLMVYLSACLTTVLLALALAGISDAPWGYIAAICVVLWATVLFGNFAESLAEGRGKAQADALRSAKRDVEACLIDNAALADAATMEDPSAFLADRGRAVGSATLKRGQVYLVRAGEQVPADGEVIMGAASVDESAITGESAPVVRESGGDRSSITGGTTVLSDWLVARVTAEAGQSFLDKMIAMVESAARKKTPNEQALRAAAHRADVGVSCGVAVLVPVRSIYRRAARRREILWESPRWWRCSCAWRLPPSARCCPLSALPA